MNENQEPIVSGRLNRNIGCIEIFNSSPLCFFYYLLNRNIGCIEMLAYLVVSGAGVELNRNIGCIEIRG